ncbi:hypothetical protein EDB82DRAFT_502237 [Fusarium venenatum]|uniref:uncharacterized protein n=1 Tax=Fusarium venenatum TaxID=56646 RepID=UPI001DD79994|nr:hypothetical protein EDB82DRAFT_502237 [Fusarium venenatum]
MSSLEGLPREILAEIPLHLHDDPALEGREIFREKHKVRGLNWRKYLMSLRAVNRMFRDLVNPLLFEHVTIFSGRPLKINHVPDLRSRHNRRWVFKEIGVSRLERLSMDPSIRKLVRRLEFADMPLDDLYAYLADPDKETNNGVFDVENLRYVARISILIHSVLPRFPNLTALRLDFAEIPYRPSGVFGPRNFDHDGTPYWVQDTADLFRSFSTAICRSGLDKLEELDLSLPIAHDFGHFLKNGNEDECSLTRVLFEQLKRLAVDVVQRNDISGRSFRLNQWNTVYAKNVQELLPLAPNLHHLRVRSKCFLSLTASSLPHSNLRLLELHYLRIAGEALTSVIERCQSLQWVHMDRIRIESGTWEDILTVMRKTSITSIDLFDCGYWNSDSRQNLYPHTQNYIHTNRVGDLKACELTFTQLHENMCRIYGSNYGEHLIRGHKAPDQIAAEFRKLLEESSTDMDSPETGR